MGKANTKTLTVNVPIVPAYKSRHVNIRATEIELNLPLTDGEHSFTTPFIDVGDFPRFFKDPVLQASLTIWYEYNHEEETLYLCANDYISEHSLYLTTQPSGTTQFCRQYNNPGNHHPIENNPHWNYCTPLTPGLKQAFAETLQLANNLIQSKALAEGISVNLYAPLPELPPEVYERLCAVYHNDEFVEMYDPEKEYTSEHSLIHLFSVYGGKGKLATATTAYANAIDTTHDPKHGLTSWISLWVGCYGKPSGCASLNFFGPGKKNNFICKGPMVGGHCIKGKLPKKPKKGGPPKTVFIIPICNSHNGKKAKPGFMFPLLEKDIVWLAKFHQ